MRPILSRSLVALALLASASILHAQSNRGESDAEWLARCRSGRGYGDNDDRGRACEVRAVPMRLSGRSLAIDGERNGGIQVTGSTGDSVLVTARIEAHDRTDEAARSLLARIHIESDTRGVRTNGPSTDGEDGQGWSVGFVVFVPRQFDLDLKTHNGGLRVSSVTGTLQLSTENGGLALDDVGGDVHARTRNGGLNVMLGGTRWSGAGLDAETQNGSVRLLVPEQYAAQLETSTVNGHMSTDFPITVRGDITRQMSFAIGGGGPTIHATTRNGSVTIARR